MHFILLAYYSMSDIKIYTMIDWDFTYNAADVTYMHACFYYVGNSCTVGKYERSDNYYYY